MPNVLESTFISSSVGSKTSSQNGSRRDKLSFTDDGVGVSGRDLVNGAKFVEDTESGFIWIDGGFDLVGGKNLQGSRKFLTCPRSTPAL